MNPVIAKIAVKAGIVAGTALAGYVFNKGVQWLEENEDEVVDTLRRLGHATKEVFVKVLPER